VRSSDQGFVTVVERWEADSLDVASVVVVVVSDIVASEQRAAERCTVDEERIGTAIVAVA